jgi:integrase
MAGRRVIPLKPDVYAFLGIPDVVQMLRKRHAVQGQPERGWVFPRATKSGHLTVDTYKDWHATALTKSKIEPFEPYCLRHTFLTWMAPHLDSFALARLAGHSSIRTTQRYYLLWNVM